MQKNFLKKGIISILILFVGTTIIPSVLSGEIGNISNSSLLKKIWYVDDDGEDYPNPDFNLIQLAIDAANPGDEIRVYNGTYKEHLTVNKSLDFSGGWNGTSIINGYERGTIVVIIHDYVSITNFVIQNSGVLNYGINIGATNVRIEKCDIIYNYFGIQVIGLHNSNVEIKNNCNISNNYIGVVFIDLTHSNKITDCKFTNNIYSVWIVDSNDNEFSNCSFTDNYVGMQIQDPKSTRNKIYKCKFKYNSLGIMLYSYSNRNIITSNDFMYNERHIFFRYCSRQFFTDNYFEPREFPNNYTNPHTYLIIGIIWGIGRAERPIWWFNKDPEAAVEEHK